MKKNLMALILAAAPFLISCKKEMLTENIIQNHTTEVGATTSRENCEPFQFGILGLNSGTTIINGIDYLSGDVGISENAISTNNANVYDFQGASMVHSQASNFLYSASSYSPAYGIWTDEGCDMKMTQANYYATTLGPKYAALPPNNTFTNINGNKTITSSGLVNTIVKITNVNMNNKTLKLVGTMGMDDGFIINVTGNFNFSLSDVVLENVRPERVLFNFPNATQVVVDRSKFYGTILSRTGTVICFEPEIFEGSIVAKNVTLFSYGSIINPNNTNNQNRNLGDGGTNTSSCTWITNYTQRTYCNGNQW